MQSYDPNTADSMSTPIQALEETDKKKGPPQGLLKDFEPEKNVDESQMAEFATPIEEIMPGPGQMIQDEMMGPPSMPMKGNVKTERRSKGEGKESKNPFGLTDEQYYAALAGVAAVIAFSKPVQGKLASMVPKFVTESGDTSMTGLLVSALVAAIVFYFARQLLAEK
jgi:Family of unknown function (DUF5792)